MPIEIRELVIRAVTVPEREEGEDPAKDQQPAQDATEDTRLIIQECVRQVLRILRREKEW